MLQSWVVRRGSRAWSSYGGDSPVIVVVNKSDERTLSLDETRLQLDYKNTLRGYWPI